MRDRSRLLRKKMKEKTEKIIWKKLDELRIQSNIRIGRYIDIPLLSRIYKEIGEDEFDKVLKDTDNVNSLTDRYGFHITEYVYDFIDSLTSKLNKEKIFDPWVTTNSYFVKKKNDNIEGYIQILSEKEIIQKYLNIDTSKIELGDGIELLENNQNKYDLVVSFPPFGVKIRGEKKKESTNDYATDLLFQLSKNLANNGKIIFLVSPKFGFDHKTKEKLKKSDLSLEGLFSLPEGTLSPTTNISSYLAVLSKKEIDNVFVAELSNSKLTNQVILKNFKKKINGKNPKLGRLISFRDFTSFRAVEQSEELRRLGKITGFKSSKFMDLCTGVKRLKEKTKEEIEHKNNSIYLPKVGNSNVISESHNLKIKPHNYFQIILDDRKANSIYIANYFNTPLGRLTLESIKVGSTIPNITKAALDNCVVYIPNLSSQFDTLSELNKIKTIESDVRDLKIKLWKFPKALPSIRKSLKKYGQKDTFKDWIDILPFPLASILWRYQATNDNTKKIEHLFHFFEAFSEFISLLLLSSFNHNKKLYEDEKKRWITNDDKFQDWYLKSTFGGWNQLTSRLTKATRTLLNDKIKKELIKTSFGKPSDEFIALVTDKALFNILEESRIYRNKWKGHGGLPSFKETKQRVTSLEGTLAKLRNIIKDGFSSSKLISAKAGTYSEGVHNYNATELTGTRTPFNEINVKSINPLDTNKLYLFHEGSDTPIELIPFLKYNQEDKACYFYNSIEGSGVRFISFHFDKNSEIEEEINDAFKEVLKILEREKTTENQA